MTTLKPEFAAFRRHKRRAANAGIGFHFTFEEWCRWWKLNLGPNWLKMRGTSWGKFVMARWGDKGDYELGNVHCVTAAENTREQIDNKTSNYGSKNGTSKLTEKDVLEIYHSKEMVITLAAKYNMSIGRISRIRSGHTWKYLTQQDQ